MPEHSGDSNAEYHAARNGAAVVDLSCRSQVELTGQDCVSFFNNLCTNDIKSLSAGFGCEFFLTTNKAKNVAHGFAHRLFPAEPLVLWLDLAPGRAAKVMAHLNHFIVSEHVEIADKTGSVAQLHVCGPKAQAVAGAVVHGLPTLVSMQHANVDGIRIGRHDRVGLPGYDLVCPGDAAASLLDRLVGAGAVPSGSDTFNTLRVEAGVPADGIDIDDERFVVEVGRSKQAICYTKGCYLGQEPIVMARDRGQVNRMLLGLVVETDRPVMPGTKVFREGAEVGQITSSVRSRSLGSVIALAYLKRGNQEPGTVVQVANHEAVVACLPFVKP